MYENKSMNIILNINVASSLPFNSSLNWNILAIIFKKIKMKKLVLNYFII